MIGGSAAAARLLLRYGSERITAVGLGVIGAGLGTLLVDPGSAILMGISMAVAGFGLGLSSVTTTSMATNVSEQQRATTSGMVNTSAQLGAAIGIAALLLAAAATTGVPGPTTDAPLLAWLTVVVLAVLTAATFGRTCSTRPAPCSRDRGHDSSDVADRMRQLDRSGGATSSAGRAYGTTCDTYGPTGLQGGAI